MDGSWTPVTAIRNYILQDPILDWLDKFGAENRFEDDRRLGQYLQECDFSLFLFRKGREFESKVVEQLRRRFEIIEVATVPSDARDEGMRQKTADLISSGAPAILHGVLWDDVTKTYGVPDLIVREDVLNKIAPNCVQEGDPKTYRVIDIKAATLHLNAAGELGNDPDHLVHKAQTSLYECALARVQGRAVSHAYILGRSWKTAKDRVNSCFDRLGVFSIDQPQHQRPNRNWLSEALEAVEWRQRLNESGANWKVLGVPSVAELRPDMGNAEDSPWHSAKKDIAESQRELTVLWQVGPGKRNQALAAGITGYDDPALSAQSCGVTGPKLEPILNAILSVNRSSTREAMPAVVSADRDIWFSPGPIEFFVDFETVTDLDDDYSRLPDRGGYPGIFMIGCGHLDGRSWQFKCFIADALDEPSERRIIKEWSDHIQEVTSHAGGAVQEPLLVHWSHAEVSFATNAYNSALERLHEQSLTNLRWYDLLNKVVKAEPFVVPGAYAFGLKAMAKAMKANGMIETEWPDGPTDGLGAMTGAWWCYNEATKTGKPVIEVTVPDTERYLMQEIRDYNEVDCKAMAEILWCLRRNH